MHWSYNYIGLEWKAYATGPKQYDCWGLVQHCLQAYFDIKACRYSDIAVNNHRLINKAALDEIKTGRWVELVAPIEGCVVLMSERSIFHHIGIFTDGVVLHAKDGADVCRQSIKSLKKSGIKRMEYWIHDSLASRP